MSLARHLAVMRNARFLRPLNEDALKFLAFASEPQALKPRETLFEIGDAADGAALVLGGQLRLIDGTGYGAPQVVGVGHLIDELALIVETQRKSTALAQSSCEVLLLPRQQMLRILDQYPDVAGKLQGMLDDRAGRFLRDLSALAERLPPSHPGRDNDRDLG